MAHAEVSATVPSVSRSITPTNRYLAITESRAYLKAAEVVYAGTVGKDGWLSALPVYAVFAGQNELWFLNPPSDPPLLAGQPDGVSGVCLAIVEHGGLPAPRRAYRRPPAHVSVVAYGRFHPISSRTAYLWFLRQLRGRPESSARLFPAAPNPFDPPVTLWKMTVEHLVGHYTPGTYGPFVP